MAALLAMPILSMVITWLRMTHGMHWQDLRDETGGIQCRSRRELWNFPAPPPDPITACSNYDHQFASAKLAPREQNFEAFSSGDPMKVSRDSSRTRITKNKFRILRTDGAVDDGNDNGDSIDGRSETNGNHEPSLSDRMDFEGHDNKQRQTTKGKSPSDTPAKASDQTGGSFDLAGQLKAPGLHSHQMGDHLAKQWGPAIIGVHQGHQPTYNSVGKSPDGPTTKQSQMQSYEGPPSAFYRFGDNKLMWGGNPNVEYYRKRYKRLAEAPSAVPTGLWALYGGIGKKWKNRAYPKPAFWPAVQYHWRVPIGFGGAMATDRRLKRDSLRSAFDTGWRPWGDGLYTWQQPKPGPKRHTVAAFGAGNPNWLCGQVPYCPLSDKSKQSKNAKSARNARQTMSRAAKRIQRLAANVTKGKASTGKPTTKKPKKATKTTTNRPKASKGKSSKATRSPLSKVAKLSKRSKEKETKSTTKPTTTTPVKILARAANKKARKTNRTSRAKSSIMKSKRHGIPSKVPLHVIMLVEPDTKRRSFDEDHDNRWKKRVRRERKKSRKSRRKKLKRRKAMTTETPTTKAKRSPRRSSKPTTKPKRPTSSTTRARRKKPARTTTSTTSSTTSLKKKSKTTRTTKKAGKTKPTARVNRSVIKLKSNGTTTIMPKPTSATKNRTGEKSKSRKNMIGKRMSRSSRATTATPTKSISTSLAPKTTSTKAKISETHTKASTTRPAKIRKRAQNFTSTTLKPISKTTVTLVKRTSSSTSHPEARRKKSETAVSSKAGTTSTRKVASAKKASTTYPSKNSPLTKSSTTKIVLTSTKSSTTRTTTTSKRRLVKRSNMSKRHEHQHKARRHLKHRSRVGLDPTTTKRPTEFATHLHRHSHQNVTVAAGATAMKRSAKTTKGLNKSGLESKKQFSTTTTTTLAHAALRKRDAKKKHG